jgi:hypothetical protein
MTTPRRIQLRRAKGWRKPEGAVVVSRPSKWGNPFLLADVARRHPGFSTEECRAVAVRQFRDDLIPQAAMRERFGYPSDEEIRTELGGRDLACWCPLDQPCHADVLLAMANSAAPR